MNRLSETFAKILSGTWRALSGRFGVSVALATAVCANPSHAETNDNLVDICFSSSAPYYTKVDGEYTDGLWPKMLDQMERKMLYYQPLDGIVFAYAYCNYGSGNFAF